MQTTLESLPVLVYPVLQVQTTALDEVSCEQMAFTSQPPLFTEHVSVKMQMERLVVERDEMMEKMLLPVQLTLVADPTFV